MSWLLPLVLMAIEVHGHRGARAVRPENSLPAFEYAIEAGADVLELDLVVTRDDVLVVSHDPLLAEEACHGPGATRVIREMTLAELGAWKCRGAAIPTLDAVLALAGRGGFQFNIETKVSRYTPEPERFAALLLAAIRRHRLEPRVIVQSFDFRTLHAMRRLAPEIRRSALYEKGDRDFVEVAREAQAGIISPDHGLVTPEKVRRARAAGLRVIPWTANRPTDWQRLAEAGVDGIISDDPAALIGWLRQRKLR